MDRAAATISPVPPYDFELTAAFQSRYGLDSMEGGAYRRLLDFGDKLVLATARSVGSINTPQLELRLQGEGLRDDDVERSTRQVEWLLGATQDLLPFYSLAASDPVMAGLVERFYGLHPTHTATLFEALVLGVLGQQIAANVARIIRTLIIEQFGLSAVIDGETYYAFPRPDAIWASSPDVLRTMKLTQRKSEYIHGLAGGGSGSRNRPERLEGSARRGGGPTAGFLAGNRQMDSSMGADPGSVPSQRASFGRSGAAPGSIPPLFRRPRNNRCSSGSAGPPMGTPPHLRHRLPLHGPPLRGGIAEANRGPVSPQGHSIVESASFSSSRSQPGPRDRC